MWPSMRIFYRQHLINISSLSWEGASVFFYLKPERSILSDLNADLIDTYRAIRDNWSDLNDLLNEHQLKHNTDYYYFIRGSRPTPSVIKAARLIYLNRTCFNGIYRVNLSGQFNVPQGTKSAVLLDTDNFEGIAHILNKAEILTSDFEVNN